MPLSVGDFPCVEHQGWLVGAGYPGVTRNGKTRLATRVLWEEERGPIPENYELHHVCGNKLCVNLSHLQLISRREHRLLHGQHKRAAQKRGAAMRAATHCSYGHEFTVENTYWQKGFRICRACRARRSRELRVRRKEVLA